MKKISYLLVIAIMAIGFSGCLRSGRDVVKFSMTMNDQEGTTVLSFVPDYSKRTLAVDYKKDNVDKKQQSVVSAGQIGGANFDKFEELVKTFRNYKVKDLNTVDQKKPSFSVTIEGKDKKKFGMKVGIENPGKEVKKLIDFYYAIVQLLTGITHI